MCEWAKVAEEMRPNCCHVKRMNGTRQACQHFVLVGPHLKRKELNGQSLGLKTIVMSIVSDLGESTTGNKHGREGQEKKRKTKWRYIQG